MKVEEADGIIKMCNDIKSSIIMNERLIQSMKCLIDTESYDEQEKIKLAAVLSTHNINDLIPKIESLGRDMKILLRQCDIYMTKAKRGCLFPNHVVHIVESYEIFKKTCQEVLPPFDHLLKDLFAIST